jgi:hypothetical protein
MIAFLVFVLLLAGCTLVATVASIALSRALPSLEAALGLSMLLMGVLLYVVFPGSGAWYVVGLVAVSHALAGGLIWYRKRVFGR